MISIVFNIAQMHLFADDKSEKSGSAIDCPVCLGTAVFPVRIPCGHVFCFLCVKGAARQAKRCPMCRQPIPTDFDKNPIVLEREVVEEVFDGGYQWFYEGKNGVYNIFYLMCEMSRLKNVKS